VSSGRRSTINGIQHQIAMTQAFVSPWLGIGLLLTTHSPATAAEVVTPCFLKLSLFTGIPGASVAELTADPSYPDSPAEVRYLREFNTRDALPTDELEDFGGRLTGFITPLESGDYHFFLSSERASELWLGSDDTEASASLIAEETDYGDPFQEPDLGDLATSAPVPLTAGERYFVMLIYKASSGGGASTDYAKVAWRRVGDSTPAAQLKPIPGAFLSTPVSDEGAPSVTITGPPSDSTVAQNSPVTFSVTAETSPADPICIQWQRNGINIPGATGATYTRYVNSDDEGARFRALVSVPGAFAESAEATLTVTSDTTPPELVSARSVPNQAAVVLTFSERVAESSATTPGNYALTGPNGATLNVTSAVLELDGTRVVLTTDPQEIGAEYTVAVSQVRDLADPSNVIASPAQAAFTALGPWLQSEDGFVVFEAEDYDRNLDGLWVEDTERGEPSGGVAMVNRNGAGGGEGSTKLEYDIFFTKTGTNYCWYRNSANDGNDDSIWLHLDGTRPLERETGNQAALSGFTSGLAGNYGGASSPFEGGGQMSFVISTPGNHSLGIARREDGAFVDKFVITTDPNFNPTTAFGPLGPPVTQRQGEPPPTGAGDFEITVQPQDVSGEENASVTLSAEVTIPSGFLYSYNWQRRQNGDFVDIPGATLLTLTVDPLSLDWNEAVVRLRVTVAGVTRYSDEATITVLAETTPPEVTHISASASEPAVFIVFSEPVSATTAEAARNYQITGPEGTLPVTGVRLLPNGRSVVLSTGPQTVGNKYTLTVDGVTDTARVPNRIVDATASFYSPGALRSQGDDGLLVVEAEHFDRNLDELWSVDLQRGTPSGGASVVNANGAGGSEAATKVEFDLDFTQAGTHILWYRASSDSGNDDSIWLHLDGDRPPERADANQASMSGFNGAEDFIWVSNAQEGSDPMTFEISAPGVHTISFARREDGAFLDKFVITTDPDFDPNDYGTFGPPETREGIPLLPSLVLTSPMADAAFPAGASVPMAVEVSASPRVISNVEFFAGSEKIGEAIQAPYTFQWVNPPAGTHSLTARLTDDALDTVESRPVAIAVGGSGDLTVTASRGPAGLVLNWTGGSPPYQVQSKARLEDATWLDVLTTTETTATIDLQGTSGFFRVASP
jgi:hypothetical protein